MKIAVIGAAGGIGQPLSLLLKHQLPHGTELSLFDILPVTPGVAADLSHIATDVHVDGFYGDDPTPAIIGADIIVVSAGIARKPGMERRDLFNMNASVIEGITEKVAKHSPHACLCIITNPVNTLVPIAAEILKKAGVYDRRKLFGITTLDVLRTETFVAEAKNLDPENLDVTVIGGHSGVTILPLLSQIKGVEFSDEEIKHLTTRIQNAGTEVVEAKAGGGSATLSMAEAATRFTLSLLEALDGRKGIIECAYVDGGSPHAEFFAQPVLLGKDGIDKVLDYGPLSDFEQKAVEAMLETLHADIELGKTYAS